MGTGIGAVLRISGKDGYTVKKLIALLLVVAFVSVGIVGCGGDTKPTAGGAKPTSGAPSGGGAGGGAKPG
jgi:hypothetical protein